MPKESLEVVGEILEVFPAERYKVKIVDMDFEVIAYRSGNMKRNDISIMPGDYVKVEINEYDNTKGRIVYRFKEAPRSGQTFEEKRVEEREKSKSMRAERDKRFGKKPGGSAKKPGGTSSHK